MRRKLPSRRRIAACVAVFFLDLRKVLMWFSLIVAVIILMAVEGGRYQDKKRLKNGEKLAEAG